MTSYRIDVSIPRYQRSLHDYGTIFADGHRQQVYRDTFNLTVLVVYDAIECVGKTIFGTCISPDLCLDAVTVEEDKWANSLEIST